MNCPRHLEAAVPSEPNESLDPVDHHSMTGVCDVAAAVGVRVPRDSDQPFEGALATDNMVQFAGRGWFHNSTHIL